MADDEIPPWGQSSQEETPPWATPAQQPATGAGKYVPNLVSDVAEVGARGINAVAEAVGAKPRKPQPFSFERSGLAEEDKYFGVIPAVKSAVEAAQLPGEVYEGKVDPLSDEGIRRAGELAMTVSPVSPGTLAAGRVLPQAALQPGERGAMSRFEKAIASDSDTREAMLERLAQARETRPQATIADVGGENVQGLLEDLAQTPGAGRTTVIPRMEARQKYQLARISNDLASITGDNRSAFRAIEQTLEAQKNAATPLYKQAFADGDRAVWNPELERLSSAPVVQDAMRAAVSGWRNQAIADGYGAMNPGAMVDRGGILTLGGGQLPAFPNIQFWDYTKKALDIQQAAFIKAHGKPSGMLTSITQQLRKSLDEEVPSYAAARRSYAGHAAFLDAIEEGRAILSKNTTAEEFRVFWEGLSESEKEGVRIGAISDIRSRMGDNAAKLPNQTKFVQAPNVRAKLNIMMPSEEVGKRFNQALDYEIGSSELVNRSLRGPATARRLAERQEAERELSAEDALALYSLTHGHGLPFAHSLWKRYGKPIQNRMRKSQDAFLAELLTASQPSPAVTRALSARKLQRATPPSPNLMQGIVTGVGAGIGGMKSGGYVKVGKSSVQYGKGMPSAHCGICKYYIAGGKCQRVAGEIRSQDWCKLFEKTKRLQDGGEVDPVPSEQAGTLVDSAGNPVVEQPPPAPEPPPLDPSLNVLGGLSASGHELNPLGFGSGNIVGMTQEQADALGTGDKVFKPYTNEEILSYVRADPFGEIARSVPSQFTRDPRVDAFWAAQSPLAQTEPFGQGAMLELMRTIPDAGRGTVFGGIDTLANIYSRQDKDIPAGQTAGSNLPSTNNWHLLPLAWQAPGMIMRNGVIIDTNSLGFRTGYPKDTEVPFADSFGRNSANISGYYAPQLGPLLGYPSSFGIAGSGQMYGWPGSVTPWLRDRPSGNAGMGQARGGLVP